MAKHFAPLVDNLKNNLVTTFLKSKYGRPPFLVDGSLDNNLRQSPKRNELCRFGLCGESDTMPRRLVEQNGRTRDGRPENRTEDIPEKRRRQLTPRSPEPR